MEHFIIPGQWVGDTGQVVIGVRGTSRVMPAQRYDPNAEDPDSTKVNGFIQIGRVELEILMGVIDADRIHAAADQITEDPEVEYLLRSLADYVGSKYATFIEPD